MVTVGTGPDDPRVWVQAAYTILDAVGQASPGDKLPTQKQLAATLGISRSTAGHAYDELTRMRLVHLIPGLGYYPGDRT
jgi:DNA-binding GntR family transcriptional regulator